MASMIMDMPYKILNSLVVNCTLYYMANLRREAGAFFFFYLVAFTMTLSMSMFFRLFASMTKTIEQALAPSAIILICLVMYTGFAIPVKYMRGYVCHSSDYRLLTLLSWASWIRWINPVSYGFESVMVNEFHDRQFQCASFVPSGTGYENVAADQRACAVQGSEPGLDFVRGTSYVETAFSYQWNNRWMNYGIIVALTFFLFIAHLVMTELVASERSKGEVLVFRRSKIAKATRRRGTDEETGDDSVHQGEKFSNNGTSTPNVQKQQSVFHWEGVNYEVQIKSETRKILDSVDGWIKPGTLTALMVSDLNPDG